MSVVILSLCAVPLVVGGLPTRPLQCWCLTPCYTHQGCKQLINAEVSKKPAFSLLTTRGRLLLLHERKLVYVLPSVKHCRHKFIISISSFESSSIQNDVRFVNVAPFRVK